MNLIPASLCGGGEVDCVGQGPVTCLSDVKVV